MMAKSISWFQIPVKLDIFSRDTKTHIFSFGGKVPFVTNVDSCDDPRHEPCHEESLKTILLKGYDTRASTLAEKRSTISDQTFHTKELLCLFLFEQERTHSPCWCLLSGWYSPFRSVTTAFWRSCLHVGVRMTVAFT